MNEPSATQNVPLDERTTGLPLLRSWRGVYWFVLAIFVTWVVLLTALSRAYS
jgi:hypothetical protein